MHLARAVNAPLFTLDIGTNSIGWAVFDLGSDGRIFALAAAGARIFSNGRTPDVKKCTTLNENRRMRRLVARRLQRRSRQVKALAAFLRGKSVLPERGQDAALLRQCPYGLRARAARAPISAHELGRALMHMAKRRGYDSGRRFGSNAEEGKVVGPRMDSLREALGGRTLSEFLVDRIGMGEPARFKPGSPFYPSRDMVRAEFELIRNAQTGLHGLEAADWERIASLMFFRRPLKPARPGKCAFLPDEDRAAKALPSVQQVIFLEALANLRLQEIPHHPRTRQLSPAELTLIADRSANLDSVELRKLRQWIECDDKARFTIEMDRGGSKGRKTLVVDRTGPVLRPVLGGQWQQASLSWRDAVAEAWLIPNEDDAAEALARLGVDDAAIDRMMQLPPPDGHHGFSAKVIRRILPHLQAGLDMSKALEAEGLAASDVPAMNRLPYYGQILTGHTQPVLSGGCCAEDERHWGRIPNPTIHIALNQLRRVVNELIDTYGKPCEMVVETTRDLKLGADKLRQLASRHAARERENKRYDEMAEQALGPASGSTRRERRLRLMLWERQGRLCMYSAQDRPITLAGALDGAVTEVDHVLPRSKTLDDGVDNLVLVYKTQNQRKGDLAPWDAFPEEQREAIRERADRLRAQNRNKGFSRELARRLGPEGPELLRSRDWLGRQLGDTGYAARVARIYLSTLVRKEAIRLVPGKVTAHIRRQLGLGKSRDDHRHHALDAICLGLVDWRALTAMHTASARDRDLPEVFVPIPGFDAAARDMIERIVVSHRRDRGRPRSLHGVRSASTTGSMHDETNYSPAGAEAAGLKIIRHRRADGIVLEKAVKTNGNAYLEIYRRADGSTGGELVSTFDANRVEVKPDGGCRPFQPRWVREHKGAWLAMRLFIGDTVAMREEDGSYGYWVIKQIVDKAAAPVLRLVRHSVALPYAEAERRKSGLACERRPSAVEKYGLRLVDVDPLGRVNGRKRWNASSRSRNAEPASP